MTEVLVEQLNGFGCQLEDKGKRCENCGIRIHQRNKSGLCRRCNIDKVRKKWGNG